MVIFYYVKRTDKVTLYLKEKVYLSPTKNAMCMVYNGSDHFGFLKVNRVTVNQVYLVLRKYGVVENFPTSSLSPDAARKKAKTQFLSLIGYHDYSSDCSFNEGYEEVGPDFPDFSGDRSSNEICDKVARTSIVADPCSDDDSFSSGYSLYDSNGPDGRLPLRLL